VDGARAVPDYRRLDIVGSLRAGELVLIGEKSNRAVEELEEEEDCA